MDGGAAAGADHASVLVPGHAPCHLAPVLAVVGEHVGEAGEVIDAEAVVHLRLPQIVVDQQHPQADIGECFGEQHIHQRFAFSRKGAVEGYRSQRPIAVK